MATTSSLPPPSRLQRSRIRSEQRRRWMRRFSVTRRHGRFKCRFCIRISYRILGRRTHRFPRNVPNLSDKVASMYSTPYATSLETRILAATPLELVSILYDGALEAVQSARRHLAEGLIRERSQAVTKAVEILMELSTSLDHERGGELSARLGDLYGYMQRVLLDANFRQTDPGLAEVEGLLKTLREAWQAVNPATTAGASAWTPQPETSPAAHSWHA